MAHLATNFSAALILLFVAAMLRALLSGPPIPPVATEQWDVRVRRAAEEGGVVLACAIGILISCAAFGIASWILSTALTWPFR